MTPVGRINDPRAVRATPCDQAVQPNSACATIRCNRQPDAAADRLSVLISAVLRRIPLLRQGSCCVINSGLIRRTEGRLCCRAGLPHCKSDRGKRCRGVLSGIPCDVGVLSGCMEDHATAYRSLRRRVKGVSFRGDERADCIEDGAVRSKIMCRECVSRVAPGLRRDLPRRRRRLVCVCDCSGVQCVEDSRSLVMRSSGESRNARCTGWRPSRRAPPTRVARSLPERACVRHRATPLAGRRSSAHQARGCRPELHRASSRTQYRAAGYGQKRLQQASELACSHSIPKWHPAPGCIREECWVTITTRHLDS